VDFVPRQRYPGLDRTLLIFFVSWQCLSLEGIMDIKIWIALLTAVVSIFVAVISLVTAWLTSRSSAKSAQTLEELRHSLQQSSEARRISDEQLSKSLDSIRASMQALQIMKDEIQLVLASTTDSFAPGEAAERLGRARDNLFRIYQEHHPNLTADEGKAVHAAKSALTEIDRHVGEDGFDVTLKETRHRLTDAQNVLRDALTARLLQRTMCAN
jgi:hypothetical protein